MFNKAKCDSVKMTWSVDKLRTEPINLKIHTILTRTQDLVMINVSIYFHTPGVSHIEAGAILQVCLYKKKSNQIKEQAL